MGLERIHGVDPAWIDPTEVRSITEPPTSLAATCSGTRSSRTPSEDTPSMGTLARGAVPYASESREPRLATSAPVAGRRRQAVRAKQGLRQPGMRTGWNRAAALGLQPPQ